MNDFYLDVLKDDCNWKLINQLFQKFCNFNVPENKNYAASILIPALSKCGSQASEEEIKLIQSIIHQFFENLFVNDDKLRLFANSWLKEIIHIPSLSFNFIEEIRSIKEPEKQLKVIEIVIALPNRKDKFRILLDIFNHDFNFFSPFFLKKVRFY